MAEKPSASVSFAGRRFLVRRLRHKLSNKDDGKEAKNIIQQDYLCKNDTVPVLDCAPARAVRGVGRIATPHVLVLLRQKDNKVPLKE